MCFTLQGVKNLEWNSNAARDFFCGSFMDMINTDMLHIWRNTYAHLFTLILQLLFKSVNLCFEHTNLFIFNAYNRILISELSVYSR
jgi:hypothetical protein